MSGGLFRLFRGGTMTEANTPIGVGFVMLTATLWPM